MVDLHLALKTEEQVVQVVVGHTLVMVMEEQVAPEVAAVVVVNPAILVVLEALVDYLMVKMEPQHQDLIQLLHIYEQIL